MRLAQISSSRRSLTSHILTHNLTGATQCFMFQYLRFCFFPLTSTMTALPQRPEPQSFSALWHPDHSKRPLHMVCCFTVALWMSPKLYTEGQEISFDFSPAHRNKHRHLLGFKFLQIPGICSLHHILKKHHPPPILLPSTQHSFIHQFISNVELTPVELGEM